MKLLGTPATLPARSALAAAGLAPLAQSLAADLTRVIERPLYIPETKALLSREGGRCVKDGALLDFDPFAPRSHQCPVCKTVHTGELHDLFWNYWYQLWLAERAVHAALLGALGIVSTATDFARAILDGYSDAYLRYPNVDNVLGPTRPFFSTYLESIWLLQLCIAADILDAQGSASPTVSRFAERVVEPSRALIASFDEGTSNRQVWNNAALMASARMLGRDDDAESVVWSGSGLAAHLGGALLADGTWYEGENYHLFAHRGLWYGMTMCDAAGYELPDDLAARYTRGFVTPLLTSLPDLTFPSRRDSQYAISLRQWRFAEMCELGLARSDDPVLPGMLDRLYASDTTRRDTGRWKSTAEAERNLPPTSLSRADLGWKSLLFAREQHSPSSGASLGSVLLESQGIGVVRRDDDRVYVAMDYGVSGGGHGHPDRLNLLLMNGETRVLDDMGTGSYVDPSLHWYRSTLAHNAPLIDGRSQDRVDGELVAFEDRGGAGWISARCAIAPEAEVERTAVVMPDYLVDELRWISAEARVVDLPIHLSVTAPDADEPATRGLGGSEGLEDGFRFLTDAVRMHLIPAGATLHVQSDAGDLWIGSSVECEVWRATAPGAPGSGPRSMLIARVRGATGLIRSVLSWKGGVTSASVFPNAAVQLGGEGHEHRRMDHGWQVAIHVGGARSTIDLEGLVAEAANEPDEEIDPHPKSFRIHGTMLTPGQERSFTLARDQYRRSEQTWDDAGRPDARISLSNSLGVVSLRIEVDAARTFVPPGTVNPLDNESADINGAGVQVYLRTEHARAGYVIVPVETQNRLSIRPIDGWGDGIEVRGSWAIARAGYVVELEILPLGASGLAIDVIVNEKPADRARRRGQLVLSDIFFPEGRREFIYLAGDRQDETRLVPFMLKSE